jgi:hypothetical protein
VEPGTLGGAPYDMLRRRGCISVGTLADIHHKGPIDLSPPDAISEGLLRFFSCDTNIRIDFPKAVGL